MVTMAIIAVMATLVDGNNGFKDFDCCDGYNFSSGSISYVDSNDPHCSDIWNGFNGRDGCNGPNDYIGHHCCTGHKDCEGHNGCTGLFDNLNWSERPAILT